MFWLIGLYLNNIEVNQVSQKDVTITCCSKTQLHFMNIVFPKIRNMATHMLQKTFLSSKHLAHLHPPHERVACKAVCVTIWSTI